MATLTRGAGTSPDQTAIGIGLTDQERALAAYLNPLKVSKAAILLDTGYRGFARNYNRDENPINPFYELIDRAGGRIFSPSDATNPRRPLIARDDLTGRDVFLFGAGGLAPYAMNSALNGSLKNASVPNVLTGAEANQLPLFRPALGWTFWCKFRVPTVSAIWNVDIKKNVGGLPVYETVSINFGATVGATLLGGGGTTVIGGTVSNITKSMRIEIQTTTGKLRVVNAQDANSANQFLSAADYRNGVWHDAVVVWNPSAGTFTAHIDGVLQPVVSGVTRDIEAGPGESFPIFGAIGGGTPNGPYVGFVAGLGWSQGTWGETDDGRAVCRNWMATR